MVHACKCNDRVSLRVLIQQSWSTSRDYGRRSFVPVEARLLFGDLEESMRNQRGHGGRGSISNYPILTFVFLVAMHGNVEKAPEPISTYTSSTTAHSRL
jgi:hypothetical protein